MSPRTDAGVAKSAVVMSASLPPGPDLLEKN